MAVGAVGIALGLALYGPRLIKTVGSEITELDQMRAFSVAMAAAITVIIASQLGLPVSSTHIAIGGIFGVGFLREWLDASASIKYEIAQEQAEIKGEEKAIYSHRKEISKLDSRKDKTEQEYEKLTRLYRKIDKEMKSLGEAKKALKKGKKKLYVKRDAIKKILTAWVITVPTAAVMAAGIFHIIKALMTS